MDFAPVIRNSRFHFCRVSCRKGVEQRRQDVYSFLNSLTLCLFFLPLGGFGFTCGQPCRFCAFLRNRQ
ncbi:hypothetical protein D3C72_756900 [compost metagenome]